MELKYSRDKFDGFTHRFLVEFETYDSHGTSLTIYSNSDSRNDLENFISEKKTEKVKSFEVVHRASKEDDERTTMLLDEVLKDL